MNKILTYLLLVFTLNTTAQSLNDGWFWIEGDSYWLLSGNDVTFDVKLSTDLEQHKNSFNYTWFVDDVEIAGKNGFTFTQCLSHTESSDQTQKIKVRVTDGNGVAKEKSANVTVAASSEQCTVATTPPTPPTAPSQTSSSGDACNQLEISKIGIRNESYGTFVDVLTDQINATYIIQIPSGAQFPNDVTNSSSTFTQKVSTTSLGLSPNQVKVFRVIDNCTIPNNSNPDVNDPPQGDGTPPVETVDDEPVESSDNCVQLEVSKIGIRNESYGTFVDVLTDQINATYIIQLPSGDQFPKEVTNSSSTFTQKVSTTSLGLLLSQVKVFRVEGNCSIPNNNTDTGDPSPGEDECIAENITLDLPQTWIQHDITEKITNGKTYEITFKPTNVASLNSEFAIYSNQPNPPNSNNYFKKIIEVSNDGEQTFRFTAEIEVPKFILYLKKNNANDHAKVEIICVKEAVFNGNINWNINGIADVVNHSNYQFGTNLNFIIDVTSEKEMFAQGIRPFKTPEELAAILPVGKDDIDGQGGCSAGDQDNTNIFSPTVTYTGTPANIDFPSLKQFDGILESNNNTGIWRQKYLEQIRDTYDVNRYMIWSGTNSSFDKEWKDRVKQYDCGQNLGYRLRTPLNANRPGCGDVISQCCVNHTVPEKWDVPLGPQKKGDKSCCNNNHIVEPLNTKGETIHYGVSVKPLAWEWMIDFSNKTNNSMWINIPHEVFKANDLNSGIAFNEYAVKLALLIKHGIDMKNIPLRNTYGVNYDNTPNGRTLANATLNDLKNLGGQVVCPPLKNNLNVHVEYSNEIWNSFGSHFKQTYYAHEEAMDMQNVPEFNIENASEYTNGAYNSNVSSDYYYFKFGGGEAFHQNKNIGGCLKYNNKLVERFSAYGHLLTWQSFEHVFGKNNNRIKYVLGHWHKKNESSGNRDGQNLLLGAIETVEPLLEKYSILNSALNVNSIYPDYIAIAPYFGNGKEGSSIDWWNLANHVNNITTQVKQTRKVIQNNPDIFKTNNSNGLQLVTYEGGQHIIKNCDIPNSKPKTGGPCNDMYDIYTLYLNKLKEDMPLFMHFTHTGAAPVDNDNSNFNINNPNLVYKGADCWGATELIFDYPENDRQPWNYKIQRSEGKFKIDRNINDAKLLAIKDHISGTVSGYGTCPSNLSKLPIERPVENATNFQVYPNPFANNLTLQTEKETGQMRIVDMTGRILLQQEVEGKTTTINTKQLKPGYYLVEVQQGDTTQTQKIIKH